MRNTNLRRADRLPRVDPLPSLTRDFVPFPVKAAAPTEHFEVHVPRSHEDQVVDIDFFSAAEAKTVQPRPDQTLLFAPDGSAFLFRIGPRSA